jgi:hypothetical protein
MLDRTDKAEHYWNLMLRYYSLAERAELPFLVGSYRKVAARYRAMAKEAFDLADAEKKAAEPLRIRTHRSACSDRNPWSHSPCQG